VKRSELAHVLRAASAITDDPKILVIGSQAILGTYHEDDLPDETVMSNEADIAFLDDPDDSKANQVDGAIGEFSSFHEMYAYYGQGVSVTTAVLPRDWQHRLVKFEATSAYPAEAVCLDKYDLAASKLAAYREKDLPFVAALIDAGLLSPRKLKRRLKQLPESHRGRAIAWLDGTHGQDRNNHNAAPDIPVPPPTTAKRNPTGFVAPYRKKDGTLVRGHKRKRP
jgi:hypothetical protein